MRGGAVDGSALKVKAFPTAEGFGASTVGGRGGKIVEVTNLDDSGLGSLRQAMEMETGPRIVVFRTGGTIALKTAITVRNANSFLTVAGQTAPGGGIQLKNHGIAIRDGAHDVVIRYLRIRPGTDGSTPENGGDIDALLVWGNDGAHSYNVVIDHCSLAWAVDENTNVWDWGTDITFQHCIIAEGTSSGHSKGPHSMGMLVGSDGRITLSVHHCLFAHNGGRNPKVSWAALTDFRNNIVYNWSCNNFASFGEHTLDQSAKANMVGNLFIKGTNSNCGGDNVCWLAGGETKIYVEGNRGPAILNGSADGWAIGFLDMAKSREFGRDTPASESQYRSHTPFPAPPVKTHSAEQLMEVVLPRVGASRPSRDAVDTRIVRDVRNLTGAVGMGSGYPTLETGKPSADTDRDGMPDDWETKHGLNPKDPSDGPRTSSNGYTNVENYLNGLVGE